jgi:hypothetical protein
MAPILSSRTRTNTLRRSAASAARSTTPSRSRRSISPVTAPLVRAGMAGDVARRRGSAHQDEVEAFEIARIDADPPRDGLAVQHARRRGAAQRQHQPSRQACLPS